MYKSLSPKALGIATTQSELIELALSFGFRGVDLDIVEFARDVRSGGMAKARRLLDSAKLRLTRFELPITWDETDEQYQQQLAELEELLSMAAEVGCKRAWTPIQPASDTRPFPQNFEFHRQRLSDLGGRLEAHGLQLGVTFSAVAADRAERPLQFIVDFDALAMLLSMVSASNVGAVVDVWQVWAGGGSLESIRKLPTERIVAVLVADGPADIPPGQWQHDQRLLPGETGVIDLAGVLSALAEAGYDGPVIPVPSASRFAGQRRDQIVKQTGESLDALWKSAGLKGAKVVGAR